MKIESLDHFVLTVRDIDATVHFYTQVLGMEAVHFGAGRTALRFGVQKINLHRHTQEYEPKALMPTPGSADLCLLTHTPIADVMAHFATCGIAVIEGPLVRTGATGPILSVYCRDPDRNLIEVANRIGE